MEPKTFSGGGHQAELELPAHGGLARKYGEEKQLFQPGMGLFSLGYPVPGLMEMVLRRKGGKKGHNCTKSSSFLSHIKASSI